MRLNVIGTKLKPSQCSGFHLAMLYQGGRGRKGHCHMLLLSLLAASVSCASLPPSVFISHSGFFSVVLTGAWRWTAAWNLELLLV